MNQNKMINDSMFHWKQNICGPSNFILNKLVLQQRGIAKSLKVKGKYCLNLFSKVPLILGNYTNFDILCSIIVCFKNIKDEFLRHLFPDLWTLSKKFKT